MERDEPVVRQLVNTPTKGMVPMVADVPMWNIGTLRSWIQPSVKSAAFAGKTEANGLPGAKCSQQLKRC